MAHHEHLDTMIRAYNASPNTSDNQSDTGPAFRFPLMVELNPDYNVPINGYVLPLITLFTMVINLLLCVALLKKSMRSPTNLVLVSLAFAQIANGLFPLPYFLRFYTPGEYLNYVPITWCYVHVVMVENIPTIAHTATVYLTVYLAIQRFIYVCRPFKASRLCTIRSALKAIAVICVVSTLMHLLRFFDTFQPVTVPSLVTKGEYISGCRRRYFFKFGTLAFEIYNNIYYWMRVVLIHVCPCVVLIVLNVSLMRAMRQAEQRRKSLVRQNRSATRHCEESRQIRSTNSRTLMLVLVMVVFLIVEVPLATVFSIKIFDNSLDLELIAPQTTFRTFTLLNLVILASYPTTFFLYCAMSKQFREVFAQTFCSWLPARPAVHNHSRSRDMRAGSGDRDAMMKLTTKESAPAANGAPTELADIDTGNDRVEDGINTSN